MLRHILLYDVSTQWGTFRGSIRAAPTSLQPPSSHSTAALKYSIADKAWKVFIIGTQPMI